MSDEQFKAIHNELRLISCALWGALGAGLAIYFLGN